MKADLEQYATYLCDYLGVELADLQIKCRLRERVDIRHMVLTCMYYDRLVMRTTIKEIASLFNQDHSTLLHAVKTVKNLKEYDKDYKEVWDGLIAHARKYNLVPVPEIPQVYEFMDKHSL